MDRFIGLNSHICKRDLRIQRERGAKGFEDYFIIFREFHKRLLLKSVRGKLLIR